MLSGRDALKRIDGTVRAARAELTRVDAQLKHVSSARTLNQRSRSQLLKQLAELRLDGITRGDVVDSLGHVDAQAQSTLQERDSALTRLQNELSGLSTTLERLEKERDIAHDQVEMTANQVASLEARVQHSLDTDQAYQTQLALARSAEAIARSAEEKTQLAEADKQDKGRPYAGDTLFSYLWERGYGTAEYRASPLTRLLDGWVATLCRYDGARANYHMLLEIPKRLAEHARAVQAQADAQLHQLSILEETAAQAAGLSQAQQALCRAEDEQDRLDDEIIRTEKQLHSQRQNEGRFFAGDDDYTARALKLLADSYGRREVAELRHMARNTPHTDDDHIVADLRDLQSEESRLEGEVDQYRRMHDEHLDRLKELEDVRHRFKRHRYDDLRSGFGNEDLILMMLNQFLRGSVGGGGLWDALKRHQRYQDVGGAWPDFGSGGFRRRRRSSTWHWPGGRGGGFRLPSGGGSLSRGGGFRTGGGF